MIDFAKLKEPFFPDELEWRPMSCGKNSGKFWVRTLAYVTNRAIQDRLDAVVTPGLWQNRFERGPDGGVICGIGIKIGEEWIWKWDGADNTDIEAVKGGLSGSMKRAAVHWGIGRYLYDLEENFGDVVQGGINWAKTKDGESFNWNPPKLPQWAMPGTGAEKKRKPLPPPGNPTDETEAQERVVQTIKNLSGSLKEEQLKELRKLYKEAGKDENLLADVETMAHKLASEVAGIF